MPRRARKRARAGPSRARPRARALRDDAQNANPANSSRCPLVNCHSCLGSTEISFRSSNCDFRKKFAANTSLSKVCLNSGSSSTLLVSLISRSAFLIFFSKMSCFFPSLVNLRSSAARYRSVIPKINFLISATIRPAKSPRSRGYEIEFHQLLAPVHGHQFDPLRLEAPDAKYASLFALQIRLARTNCYSSGFGAVETT